MSFPYTGGPLNGPFQPNDPEQNNFVGIVVLIIGSIVLLAVLFWIADSIISFSAK